MKYFFSLFLIAAVSFNLQAQRNFKPGYIVTLADDTTRGFVDYKEWNQNPRDVTFKITEQASSKQYSPNDIKAFGVYQLDSYRTYTGPITTGAVDLADLSSGIDSSAVNDNVFLRSIVEGKNIALFAYKDNIKTRYFISEKNGGPAELKRYVYLDNRQSDKIREFNFYTQQLLALAGKYAPNNTGLSERIQKLPYRAQDLEDIV